jgi:hypothetical protein
VSISLDVCRGAVIEWMEDAVEGEGAEVTIALPSEERKVNIVNELMDGQRRVSVHVDESQRSI